MYNNSMVYSSLRLRSNTFTFCCYIAYVIVCFLVDSTDSFSFFSPFLQRPSTPFTRIDKKCGNHNKNGPNAQKPISAIISEEEKQVANVIASSIIKESEAAQITQQSSPGELNVNIREASYTDLLSVSSLRVNVFYPELITNGAFHTRILEKLRKRKNDGAVCLVALEKEGIAHNPPASGYRYEHILGTVEFSPNDFRNSSMENVGDVRKLYAMDLAIRKSARRYGLATRLLHSIEIYAANHDYREVYLHVEADNKAARYLYKKCGYGEIDLSTNEWAREFTSKRLHKTPDSYVFLYKRLSSISQREILSRQSHVLSHMISSVSSSPSSSVRESTSLF